MAKQSAGILLYKNTVKGLEFFLVHPGGPFFRNKDLGYWTVPKGEFSSDELPLDAAVREFEEETGYRPEGKFIELQPIVQKGGKQVWCWAVAGDLDHKRIHCNTFDLEWPPNSGKTVAFEEVDKAGWFSLAEAKQYINEKQFAFLLELNAALT